jgi:hypothetical protein
LHITNPDGAGLTTILLRACFCAHTNPSFRTFVSLNVISSNAGSNRLKLCFAQLHLPSSSRHRVTSNARPGRMNLGSRLRDRFSICANANDQLHVSLPCFFPFCIARSVVPRRIAHFGSSSRRPRFKYNTHRHTSHFHSPVRRHIRCATRSSSPSMPAFSALGSSADNAPNALTPPFHSIELINPGGRGTRTFPIPTPPDGVHPPSMGHGHTPSRLQRGMAVLKGVRCALGKSFH